MRVLAFRLLTATSLMVCFVNGCALFGRQEPPPPFVAPPLAIELTGYVGTPLSGPTSRPVGIVVPRDALSVKVTFYWLERVPTSGKPLGEAARLITAVRLGTPVLPSSRLTGSARLEELSEALAFPTRTAAITGGRITVISSSTLALPKGVTTTFTARDLTPLDPRLTGAPTFARVDISAYRPMTPTTSADAQPVELAIAVEDLASLELDPDRNDDTGGKDPPATRPIAPSIVQREIAILDRSVKVHDAVVITFPFRFGQAPGKAIAAVIELAPGNDSPEHQSTVVQSLKLAEKSAAALSAVPSDLSVWRGEIAGLRVAVEALGRTDKLRPTMVYLAGQTGARLFEDVSLVADDQSLLALSDAVQKKISGSSGTINAEAMGWKMELATLEMLARLYAGGKLPPELRAVLVSHTGEAGRHPSSLEELTRGLSSRQDLENRLLAENLIYLEDSSPASRVRAFDYLRARNRGPADFDPLGPPRERRLAIERALSKPLNAPATAPSTGGQP